MSRSLTFKMFLSLLLSFLSIITITLLLIYIYFIRFYQEEKINQVIDQINIFSDQMLEEQWSGEMLYEEIVRFNAANSINLNVYDYGENSAILSNFVSSGISVSTPGVDGNVTGTGVNGIFYYLSLKGANTYYDLVIKGSDFDELTSKVDMIQSSSLFVEGYVDPNNYIIAEKIGGVTLRASKAYLEATGTAGLKYFSQELKLISTQEIYNIVNNGAIYQTGTTEEQLLSNSNMFTAGSGFNAITFPYVSESYLVSKERNGVDYTLIETSEGEPKQVYFTKQMTQFNRKIQVFTTESLQSVDEVVDVMLTYIPVFFVLSLLFATLIAAIFSKKVTKPIISLSETANNMANMELDSISELKGSDELGVLSNSINQLAANLKNTMEQLVDQNQQLTTKMELKAQQEAERKIFVANVSHELKTPLGIIKSYMEAIRDGVKIEKQSYYMKVILDEIETMDSLIKEMLILSKLDEGKVKYSMSLFDLEPLLMEIVTHFDEALKVSGLRLDIKTPLGIVYGDQEKIYQVLVNLFSNAVKYSTQDTTIRIETIVQNEQVEFYIHNECDTFSEDELERIWERFFKIDSSHNRDKEGSGIGLTIVKSILEDHQAKYGVYNTSKGVCFYFVLPSVDTENDQLH